MALLFRILFLIPAGYIAACLAGGFTLASPLLVGGGAEATMLVVFAISVAFVVGINVGPFAAVPMLIAVILAERFAWRSFFFWTLLGGAIGLASLSFGPVFEGAWTSIVGPLHAAAGCVGGAVYWAIAGRSSGKGIAKPPLLP